MGDQQGFPAAGKPSGPSPHTPFLKVHINIVIGKCVKAQLYQPDKSELDVRRIPAPFNWICRGLKKKIWSQNNLLDLSGNVLLSLTDRTALPPHQPLLFLQVG